MTLRDMNIGGQAKVIGLQKGNKAYRKKLLAMGLTPGTEFSVTRYAPMGDPIEINVRGFALSLRKNEAAPLLIKRLEQ